MHPNRWWPLDLSAHADAELEHTRETMAGRPPTFDRRRVARADEILVGLMARHVDEILDASTLPQYAHLLNGWGNGRWRGTSMADRLEEFLHWRGGVPRLLQCHPEGDFHPWQTLAYAVMAGLDATTRVGESGTTLGAIARNSRELNTTEGRELGHLLYALAVLDPEMAGGPFVMGDERCTMRDLLDRAVDAHYHGTFDVCRKFHLTEGICAVAATIDGMSDRREEAQMFLDGQLDMLLLVCVIFQHARRSRRSAASRRLVGELRDTLMIGSYVENHFYYVGHLVELAELARLDGYTISPAHEGAILYAASHAAHLVERYWRRLSFVEAFLHLGHLRRAITLVASRLDAPPGQRRQDFLSRYTADLASANRLDRPAERPEASLDAYDVVEPTETPDAWFEAIVRTYRESAPTALRPRGGLPHFRRVLVPGWPRALHYELLRGPIDVGVEIHAEGRELAPVAACLGELADRLAQSERSGCVALDTDWTLGTRIRIAFERPVEPDAVARALTSVIESTRDVLDGWVRSCGLHRPELACAVR